MRYLKLTTISVVVNALKLSCPFARSPPIATTSSVQLRTFSPLALTCSFKKFGRVYKSGEAEARTKARLAGKVVRRSLTDAIKSWLDNTDRPLEHSTIYAQCTNQIYLALWGVTAADIRKHFNLKPGNIPPTRDYLSEHVLRVIDRAEDRVIEEIDYDSAIPHENAVEIARIRPARINFTD